MFLWDNSSLTVPKKRRIVNKSATYCQNSAKEEGGDEGKKKRFSPP